MSGIAEWIGADPTRYEHWVPIPWAPDYEVSNLGRVRSWRPCTRHAGAYILKASVGDAGYRVVSLRTDEKQIVARVHRLVMAAFRGPRPPGLLTRHLNGDKLDNRLENLQWGTPAENAQDDVAHGINFNVRKTACPKGHPYDAANTRISRTKGRGPFRLCKACQADAQRARRARHRAELSAA